MASKQFNARPGMLIEYLQSSESSFLCSCGLIQKAYYDGRRYVADEMRFNLFSGLTIILDAVHGTQ